MDIDKTIGYWSTNSTLLDDYSYQLYINYMIETYGSNISFGAQCNIMLRYIDRSNKMINEFYNEAIVIIRKEKISKLNKI